uniref:Uncharacterized protein n=1 Tax=Candidatus Kentrum sp. FW TaxID=2126338 RepID=A0A450TF68_9GAMM|nr:MAG: hypothetical protein BECKFW1821C_GA0114237_100844 [Candidatus Kentron sp. FW]
MHGISLTVMLIASLPPENEKTLGWLGSSAASPQMFFHSNGHERTSITPGNETAAPVGRVSAA